jgi:putative transposase
MDGNARRKVWHNFRETRLTYERSYFARLNYVHQTPVKHGMAAVANLYPYCSAAWLETAAKSSRVRMIYGFRTDRILVLDEYEPE